MHIEIKELQGLTDCLDQVDEMLKSRHHDFRHDLVGLRKSLIMEVSKIQVLLDGAGREEASIANEIRQSFSAARSRLALH